MSGGGVAGRGRRQRGGRDRARLRQSTRVSGGACGGELPIGLPRSRWRRGGWNRPQCDLRPGRHRRICQHQAAVRLRGVGIVCWQGQEARVGRSPGRGSSGTGLAWRECGIGIEGEVGRSAGVRLLASVRPLKGGRGRCRQRMRGAQECGGGRAGCWPRRIGPRARGASGRGRRGNGYHRSHDRGGARHGESGKAGSCRCTPGVLGGQGSRERRVRCLCCHGLCGCGWRAREGWGRGGCRGWCRCRGWSRCRGWGRCRIRPYIQRADACRQRFAGFRQGAAIRCRGRLPRGCGRRADGRCGAAGRRQRRVEAASRRKRRRAWVGLGGGVIGSKRGLLSRGR